MGLNRLRAVVDVTRRTPLHPQWLLATENAMAQRIGSMAPGRVLDIGCATRWVEKVLAPGSQYVGIDYDVTGKRLYCAVPDVFADAAALPIGDACVDAVVLLEVLEHLRRPREALREIARVLRPGGRLFLSMPFLYPVHDAPHDFQRYTRYGLSRELEEVGLRVEELSASLGSAETAGLIASLAMGGMAAETLRQRSLALAFLPLIAVLIPVVNVLAFLLGKLMPAWPAVTVGYSLVATKP